MELIVLFIAAIMGLVAIVHYYWAFGGKKWSSAVIPTSSHGEMAFKPGAGMTFAAATVFLVVAIYFFLLAQFVSYSLPVSITKWATWTIGGVFILRGIGDFRYFGLFKQIRETRFAKMDSRYYTPLVFILGALSLLAAFQTQ